MTTNMKQRTNTTRYSIGYRDCIDHTGEEIFVEVLARKLPSDARIAFEGVCKSYPDMTVECHKVSQTYEIFLSRQAQPKAKTIELDAQCKKTTVKVQGKDYYIYEYTSDVSTDIIIRDRDGFLIDASHPMYVEIGRTYTDSSED